MINICTDDNSEIFLEIASSRLELKTIFSIIKSIQCQKFSKSEGHF